jgi:predicted ATPase/class 3 adenylate cyclase
MAHDAPVRGELPTGTVTLLFTDIEGSTRLLQELGAAAYAAALDKHRALLHEAIAQHGGVEVDTQGDALFAAFPTAEAALEAATGARQALEGGPIRVRIGVHTGTPLLTGAGYVGPDVHLAARLAAAGHGGQVLVSSTTAALVGQARELRDLGIHRLRDIATSQHVYQLGRGEFPALRTVFESSLPLPPTSFVGRQAEVEAVLTLLRQDDVHLVTLTGPGGTGKTRLAIEVATRVAQGYPDGVFWVPLASLRDPALVMESAARAINAGDDLAGRIGDRHLLLVFDNFEQVVSAAVQVAELLARCPHMDLIVTSREPLHLAGEHEHSVPPMVRADGVQLFLARARAARHDIELGPGDASVADLCRRLDDLPLAIELVAARVRVLSPAQILERLDPLLPLVVGGPRDAPERQRTLRATIDWSFELLDDVERQNFVRLAVFRGGCTLATAAAVAGVDLDSAQSLVEKSLLGQRDGRLVMLETIREYAGEKLARSAQADGLRQRHAEHYLAFVEAAEPHVFEFSRQWLDDLALEHDNVRAALDHFEAAGDLEPALRLAGSLQRFWIVRGHLAEGRRRLERLLALDGKPSSARAKALNGVALLALNMGDAAEGRVRASEALEIYRQLGNDWGAARSRFIVGYSFADEGRFEQARELLEQSRTGFLEQADEHNALFVGASLSWAYRELGEVERARVLDEQNLRRARELGNDSIVALSLAGLAMAALEEGRAAEALKMLTETLEIDRNLGDVRRSVDDLCRLCRVLAVTGKLDLAARLLAGAEGLHAEIGASVSPEIAELNRQTVELIRQQIGQPALAEAQAAGRRMTFEEAFRLALG